MDINEGDYATLTGTYDEESSSGSAELHIDWDGDGMWDQTEWVSGGSFSLAYWYGDDDPT